VVGQLDFSMFPALRGLNPLIGGLLEAILHMAIIRDVRKPKETE
jgi:hypothetical protein